MLPDCRRDDRCAHRERLRNRIGKICAAARRYDCGGSPEHARQLIERQRLHDDASAHPGVLRLRRERSGRRALPCDEQVEPRPGAGEREKREKEIGVPSVRPVARREAHHPAQIRIEDRRKHSGAAQVRRGIEQAAEHHGARRGCALLDEGFANAGRGADGALRGARRASGDGI